MGQRPGIDCIFCVGDKVANDPVWKTTLKMGKPTGCKLVIKDMAHAIEAINSGVTDKYRMIICLCSIEEAKQLVEGCPQIKSLNLGNTLESPTTKQISPPNLPRARRGRDAQGARRARCRGRKFRALADDKKEKRPRASVRSPNCLP